MKKFQYNKNENLKKFNSYFDDLISNIDDQCIVVTDADETVSTKDTSRIFWEMNFNKQSWIDFRSDFIKTGRNFKGFLKAANTYSQIEKDDYIKYCNKSSEFVELRKGWNEFMNTLPLVIVVTSGIKLLWENVIKSNDWNNVVLVGGNYFDFDDFIVDPDIKFEIVKKLRKAGKKVIAFGDSRIDAPMLKKADSGIAIANERKSPGLAECLVDSKNIYQMQMEEEKLKGIPLTSFDELLFKYFKNINE